MTSYIFLLHSSFNIAIADGTGFTGDTGTIVVTTIIVSLVVCTSIHSSSGKYQQLPNTVNAYGLSNLTKDILQKIKTATGQPIDINYFVPILAESSGYEILEAQPYVKTSKYSEASKKKKLDGGFYHSKKGKKGSEHEKDHYYELSDFGENGKDFFKNNYGDYSGLTHTYHEGRFVKKNHHKAGGGKKGGKSKKGRKRGKFHVEKGFRDIYHKDEEKKSDFFWNNQHEEGKWIQYGLKNRKTSKSNDKGEEGKKVKDKKEESSYEKKEDKCTKCKTR